MAAGPEKVIDVSKLAIKVKELNFGYGKEKILRKLSMNVPTGSLYGLLGPSGCGKTTLLKCITGSIKYTRGTITVLGHRPNSAGSVVPGPGVGYMPQESALYNSLTLNETLMHFGRLYYMRKSLVAERIKHLQQVLQLPDGNKRVEHLSGGQKRRLSLAVALIYLAPLIILDEPTGGVDPLLREVIWKYLVSLSVKEQITMVITTHYIDEASYTDIVGFIRKGHMLVENSPANLLLEYKKTQLEEVFLEICRAQCNYSLSLDVEDIAPAEEDPLQSPLIKSPDDLSTHTAFTKRNWFAHHLWFILALTVKNYIMIAKNPITYIMNILSPVFGLILCALCVGNNPKNIDISFHAPENDSYSLMFNNMLHKGKFIPLETQTAEEAINLVWRSKAWGALVFPENYTRYLQRRTTELVDDLTINHSMILYHGDYSVLPIQQYIWKTVNIFAQKVAEEAFNITSDKIMVRPLVETVPLFGSGDTPFRDFFAAGVIVGIIFLTCSATTALSLVAEKKEGILERCYVLGVKAGHIYCSQLATHALFMVLQTVVFLIFIYPVFSMARYSSISLTTVHLLLQSISGMSFGLLVSTLSGDEQEVILLVIGCYYPIVLLSGVIWPEEGMPIFMQYFSQLLPHTAPIVSLRSIWAKGWGVTSPLVYMGFVVGAAWTAIFLILTALIVSIKGI